MDNDPSGTHNQSHQRVGRGMVWLAAIGVLVILTLLFQGLLDGRGGNVTMLSDGRVVIDADQSGHYFSEGTINGVKVGFLLDTGATDVAISEDLARELGLQGGPQVTIHTANGTVQGRMTRLDSVTLGHIHQRNVRATIVPRLGEDALLGMSFLGRLELSQSNGQLTLTAPEQSNQDT